MVENKVKPNNIHPLTLKDSISNEPIKLFSRVTEKQTTRERSSGIKMFIWLKKFLGNPIFSR